MSCKKIPHETLMRLHDGELRGLRAVSLRRHVPHCTACSQALAELRSVDALLRSADSFLPEPKQARIALRPLGFIGGGIALAAGASLFFVMPGGVVRPTPSFAQVEEAIARLRTASWVVTVDGDGPKISTMTKWADLVKGQIATQQKEMGGGWGSYHSLYDGTNTLSFFSGPNLYILSGGAFQDDYRKGATPLERVRRTVLFQQEEPDSAAKPAHSAAVTWSAWVSHRETLEGNPTLRFDRTAVQHVDYNKVPKKYALSEKVWVEPGTYQIIRREVIVDRGEGKRRRMICSGYQYNETPPLGTFEIQKPKLGVPYHFDNATDHAVARSIAALTEAERTAVKEVIQRAIVAWDRGDADGFVNTCDFNEVARRHEVARTPTATNQTPKQYAENLRWQWRSRVKSRDAYLSWKAPVLKDVHYTTNNVGYIRRTESDPFPPQLPYETYLNARVLAQVRLKKDPTREQTLETTFNLVKGKGQWRIFWFNQWTSSTQWGGKKIK